MPRVSINPLTDGAMTMGNAPPNNADFPISVTDVDRQIAAARELVDRDFDKFGWNGPTAKRLARKRRVK